MTEETTLSVPYTFQPAVITADFRSMREKLLKMIEPYEGLTAETVASMDMKEAKACRSDLNAISNNLNDARKAIKREYNKPLKEFEDQVKELDALILAPKKLLDEGIKEREEMEKQDRRDHLEEVYQDFAPALVDVVPFDRILIPQWLNKTYGEKKAENELCDKVAGIAKDWDSLKKANLNYPQETEARFFSSLSLGDALAWDQQHAEEMQRLEAMKAEVEQVQAEQVEPEDPKPAVSVRIPLTSDERLYRFSLKCDDIFVTNINEATALKNHLALLGIEFSMTKSRVEVNGW